MTDLRHIENWIFDLDNTLYKAECRLFDEIDARMTSFIRERIGLPHPEARRLQKDYYVRYGTTMSGLMHEHDVKPDQFLDYVHDIDLSPISHNEPLEAAIAALPGKRLIYTNGSVRHAENVTSAMGIDHLFDGIFDIKAANYTPKPHRAPYESFVRHFAIDPGRAAMFEDLIQNLETPHALGMTTVLVHSTAQWLDDEPQEKRPARPGETAAHVHHVTDDLADFLQQANTRIRAA